MIVCRFWYRGSNRDDGFCGSRYMVESVREVRERVREGIEDGSLLEFCGCGWHYKRYYDENGSMWSRCREELYR